MTNVNLGQPVKNKHKVPKKQWNKWSNFARRVFNDMMYSMRPKLQFAFLHPGAMPMAQEHWQTVRWNAAWSAAEAVRGFKFASATKKAPLKTKWEKSRVKRKA
jgi:hypothetical protein